MRRRLMLAMVGLVAVVLVIAGAGSLILTRNAARNQAKQQLVSEANSLTSSELGSESLKVLDVMQQHAQARGRRRHPDRPPRQRGHARSPTG